MQVWKSSKLCGGQYYTENYSHHTEHPKSYKKHRLVNRAQIVAPLWYWALGVVLFLSIRPHFLPVRWEYGIQISHVYSSIKTGDTH